MNIVVLCGGTSTEREISLISSEGICRALRSRGHQAVLMMITIWRRSLPASKKNHQNWKN